MPNNTTKILTIDDEITASYSIRRILKGLVISLFGLACIAALAIGIGAIAGWATAVAVTAWLAVALNPSTIAIALIALGGMALLSLIGSYGYYKIQQRVQDKLLSLTSSSDLAQQEFLPTELLRDTAYLYYQGRGCSQTQATKYIGNDSMQTTTGEIAKANPPAF